MTIAGLLLDMIGAAMLIWPVLTMTKSAMTASRTPFYDNRDDSERQPPKDLVVQRWLAWIGCPLLAIGFALQLADQI